MTSNISAGEESHTSKPDEHENRSTQSPKQVRNSKGWDGKLRVDKRALKSMQGGRGGDVDSVGERKGISDGGNGDSDDEEGDSSEDEDETVDGEGGGVVPAVVPAEPGSENRKVEVRDGEEIEADEG